MFEQCLLTLIAKSDGQVTTRTVAQVATELAVGVLGPVAAQIDPLRLGHEQRALDIAARSRNGSVFPPTSSLGLPGDIRPMDL